MDKETRDAVRKATEDGRKLLREDFSEQLLADFNIHEDGRIDAPGSPALAAQHAKVVAAIAHKRAAGFSPAEAVADYLRDAAFTTLNRFGALKMLEARELVQQCVSKGEESSGYQEFCGLAPGLRLLPNRAGYRLYIESLFDELSTEVKVLFDRHDPATVLWPRRIAFDQLLVLFNDPKLASVWPEDETIGWMYQFSNSDDDRRNARYDEKGKPKAPQNSRELAVRNQFFTPRYIVEFLTDNTLGRIWYEMRRTQTTLAQRCVYLIRQPDEVFEPRAKKDPRDLRVLDPSCGSGHFLLYVFDVLLSIYDEAYTDPDSPASETTGRTLAAEYPDIEALHRAMPALILAHNLHGVDIDPRCAQIAQLAMWMRAQRAFRDFDIARDQRPRIRKSNIVVAEPLIADDATLREFLAGLKDPELARIFASLIDALKLAGDMGLLLRLETLVAPPEERNKTGALFAPAEARIRAALREFVASSVLLTTQRRLFIDDAAQGIGLLEAAEQRYDVVLMNPPFGEPTELSEKLINGPHNLPTDLYCSFFARGMELAPQGRVGAITSSSFLLYTDYEGYRQHLICHGTPQVVCDLGWGVLDAQVATAAYVVDCQRLPVSTLFIDISKKQNRNAAIISALAQVAAGESSPGVYEHILSDFANLAGAPFAYWFSRSLLQWIARAPKLESLWRDHGIGAGPHNLFFRLRWELPLAGELDVSLWPSLSNGGQFSPFFRDNYLHIDWRGNGHLIKAHLNHIYPYLKGNVGIKIQREHVYLLPGLTYGKRTERFNAQILPQGSLPSFNGVGAYPENDADVWWLLAYMNSRFVAYFLNLTCGLHKNSVYIDRVPLPDFTGDERDALTRAAQKLWALAKLANSPIEISSGFSRPALVESKAASLAERLTDWRALDRMREVEAWACIEKIERIVLGRLDLPSTLISALESDQGPSYWDASWRGRIEGPTTTKVAARPIVCRNDGVGDTDLFLAMVKEGGSPAEVAQRLNQQKFYLREELLTRTGELVSWLIGCSFGRWDPTRSSSDHAVAAPFSREPWLPDHAAAKPGASVTDVMVLDERHPADLHAAVLRIITSVAPEIRDSERDLADALGAPLRAWLAHEFFDLHVATYSQGGRSAPIYWQLTTTSGSYSIWLYVHKFNRDTLFRVQKDHVEHKLRHEERKLETLHQQYGANADPAERAGMADQEIVVGELRSFLEEIRRVAPLWNPDLNDGVLVNFAPLWRLVPQSRAWQKKLKSTWDDLCDEQYEWAHLAMHLWPERVVPKCAGDRSLAIAHGLEDVFWVQSVKGKWAARNMPTRPVEELIRERSSVAVKAALASLLEAPIATTGRGKRGRASKTINMDTL